MLQPLNYHKRVTDHFKAQPKTWDFFAAAKNKDEQLKLYKTELLKSTYKFDPTVDKTIYAHVELAKGKLGLQHVTVTVHQAQYTDDLNASIIYLNNDAQIVFSGQIINILTEAELMAVIAHELTHVKLYTVQEGQMEVAARIITAIANNHNSEASYFETARLFRLYTEIYCDRGAYTVLGDIGPVITSLVKTATGLQQVNAESYVNQAQEILASEKDLKSTTLSHPENFIRALAISLWHEKKEAAEGEIMKMIEGSTDIDQLDIFKQQDLAQLTRTFLQLYLKPKWFQSPIVTSHARQYFPNFVWNPAITLQTDFRDKIETAHASIKDYLSYILLDFALIDPALEDVPGGWAFQFSEDVGLKDAFDVIIKKEMKFSDKKLQQHKHRTLSAFQGVKEGEADQIYEG